LPAAAAPGGGGRSGPPPIRSASPSLQARRPASAVQRVSHPPHRRVSAAQEGPRQTGPARPPVGALRQPGRPGAHGSRASDARPAYRHDAGHHERAAPGSRSCGERPGPASPASFRGRSRGHRLRRPGPRRREVGATGQKLARRCPDGVPGQLPVPPAPRPQPGRPSRTPPARNSTVHPAWAMTEAALGSLLNHPDAAGSGTVKRDNSRQRQATRG